MMEAFSDRRRAAARQGRIALVGFWLAATVDLARNAVAEHRLARRQRSIEGGVRSAGWLHDVRQGLRNVWRQPGVTLAVVLTLGLGVGANATVFSALSGLLGPLPFPDSGRLVQVWQAVPHRGIEKTNVTPAAAVEWMERADLFDAVGVYVYTTTNVTDVQPPERLPVARVSAGFFDVLAVSPLLGRPLRVADTEPGAPRVVLLSERFWRRRFAGDPSAVGQTVRLGNTPHTIVGVMPARFEHLSWRGADVWAPLVLDPGDRGSGSYRVVARLRAGISDAAAERALDIGAEARSREFGEDEWPAGVTIRPLHDELVGDAASAIVFVQAAALVVLLIACANLANLLLARSAVRQREFAIRAALGAGRWRLFRQALVESVVVCAIGGLAGLLVAIWGVQLVVASAPADMPRLDQIRLDRLVLMAGLGLAGLTGVVVGLTPAWRLSRAGVDRTRLADGRSATAVRQRPLQWLIVGEIALAVVVLGASGLLARALVTLQAVDVGLDIARVVAAEVSLPSSSYPSPEAQRTMFDRMVERVGALPGVEVAGLVDTLPLSQSWSRSRYRLVPGTESDAYLSLVYRASADYFRAVGIPVLSGRAFDARDAGGPPVLLVSEAVATQHWPNQTPLGQRIWFEQSAEPFTVIGVVADVHHTRLGTVPEGGLYLSASQLPLFRGVLVARTTGDPHSLIPPMRRAVAELDQTLPLFNTRTIGDLRAEALSAPRLIASLTALFATFALVLGVVGVYGLVAFSVASRRRETGVRMALGARPADVVRLFLRQGLWLAGIGLAIGLPAVAAVGALMASAAPEIPSVDAVTLAGVGLVLGAATLAASVLPARRARRVDPVEVIRTE